ncbi:MAG: DUF5661 family protein [Candidatus Thorarchaeota archaeon]
MDKKNYLDTLKSIDLRPGKVKIKEHEPQILMEQGNDGMNDLHNEIIKWFMENPYPKDDAVHAFAEKMGIDPDEFEGHIYMVLSQILSEGSSKDFKGTYDSKELKMGIEIEKEHTPNELIAEKISKDHLAEISDYYTRLAKMEKEAGVEEQKLIELFVQTGEIKTMPAGPERDAQILRIGMIAEIDAVNFYNQLAELATDERVRKIMLDVSYEEKVHAGEFETLLEELDPDYEKAEDEGENEVDDLLGI